MGKRRLKPPRTDIVIVMSVAETAAGQLSITAKIPDGADSTVAITIADAAMKVMRAMLTELTGQTPPMTESRLQ